MAAAAAADLRLRGAAEVLMHRPQPEAAVAAAVGMEDLWPSEALAEDYRVLL